MLYPSIDKLLNVIDSKYSLVTIAARRARQFQEDEDPKMEKYLSHKYVGKSLEEIYNGVIKIKKTDDED
ncbi:DNA-directed RNA polymerase subunit omega [Bacillus sp. FJAT-50079]|uniref:DNA-directed RNA polymerase subunit omega n=1 Tax=Bacillus sp. FJAT-50079 TaxID=2833577 RepID=UPI001BCA4578|nr:DNA-directed RNA polymerase subunit omega [Bacillus sp. FJAT-50079]MBS4207676.1 DNA-directed RNA polymerase subunit omega [Bacillus sp. FJAT-50079]